MRCMAHIINLVVNDGLKEIVASISRVQAAIRYIRQSPSRVSSRRVSSWKELGVKGCCAWMFVLVGTPLDVRDGSCICKGI